MDTVKSAIEIAGKKIHPETSADCVKYNNTNAKTFMEGVLSTANLSQAVQTIFKSKNYTEACRALKVAPETYFDECFNQWTPTNSPTVSNGSLIITAGQVLTTTNTIPLTGDFCAQINFTTGSDVSSQQVAASFNCSASKRVSWVYIKSSTLYANIIVGSTGNVRPSTNISANTSYYVEMDYDSDAQTWYYFVNGSLIDSVTYAYSTTANYAHNLKLGAGNGNSPTFTGKINEFRFSNCIRHTTAHTPTDSDYFTYDDNTISLLHFD